MSSVITSFADPKRMVLATGSVPTENLPTRSHEGENVKKRHVLVKHTLTDQPSTVQHPLLVLFHQPQLQMTC